MKKYNYIGCLIICLLSACVVTSCNDDELESQSIFDTSSPERNEFDEWLLENYVTPYNIDIKYKWEDIETNMSYDLVPAGLTQSIILAKIIKYVWLEAYDEIVGINFMRSYAPKQILFIGSAAYEADTQSTTLGTAEGGLKIILYNVNTIDRYVDSPDYLNKYYFHTMHHEFAHILHQTVDYSTDFEQITASEYIGSTWAETADTTAYKLGFVSAYAMDEPDEDFAEVIAVYVTNDQTYWDDLLIQAGDEGATLVNQKFTIVKNYLSASWGIDIDQLREIVQRRTSEVSQLDLETL